MTTSDTPGPSTPEVECADCKRRYVCRPTDDHYLPNGSTDGQRVCFTCLMARNGFRPVGNSMYERQP